MTPTISNMEAVHTFGNTDMKNSYLKYHIEKVSRLRHGLELRDREKPGRRP